MFLDERGHRGLIIRSLGVLGALISTGALALLVVGVLVFAHGSPLRSASPQVPSLYTHRAAPRGASERTARNTAARIELAGREGRADLRHEKRERKERRAKA